ncbi:3771_t:CDS:2 [Ambispora gerdemannii]|uniref:3771_t:CDS:1 n=1 Tax=Ambispora gerdemannii TaxID=144530 RepID=A0A9N8YY43_9GLOM|nr:3771_t:CDS:2 [Ambispora gerdemannii]
MDGFDARIAFLERLKRLTPLFQTLQKAAHFAICNRVHYEDLFSCMKETLDEGSMNCRVNILYVLDYILEYSRNKQFAGYFELVEEYLPNLVDKVVPYEPRGRININHMKKLLQVWKKKEYFSKAALDAAEEALERRKKCDDIGKARFNPQEIQKRIEEDRERHKRLREHTWILPSTSEASTQEFDKFWEDTSDLSDDDYKKILRENKIFDPRYPWREDMKSITKRKKALAENEISELAGEVIEALEHGEEKIICVVPIKVIMKSEQSVSDEKIHWETKKEGIDSGNYSLGDGSASLETKEQELDNAQMKIEAEIPATQSPNNQFGALEIKAEIKEDIIKDVADLIKQESSDLPGNIEVISITQFPIIGSTVPENVNNDSSKLTTQELESPQTVVEALHPEITSANSTSAISQPRSPVRARRGRGGRKANAASVRGTKHLGIKFVVPETKEDVNNYGAELNSQESDSRPINLKIVVPKSESPSDNNKATTVSRRGSAVGARRGRGSRKTNEASVRGTEEIEEQVNLGKRGREQEEEEEIQEGLQHVREDEDENEKEKEEAVEVVKKKRGPKKKAPGQRKTAKTSTTTTSTVTTTTTAKKRKTIDHERRVFS